MKLTTTTQVSVDGVMQAPGGRDEDGRGVFERGGWARPHFDDAASTVMDEIYQRADAFLFGRRTYERLHPPRADRPRPQDAAGQTNEQHFMNSRYAIMLMNRQNASAEGFIQPWVAVAPLPKGPAGRFSQSPFDAFGLGSGTKEPAPAWEVLKFRTGDALRRALHAQGLGGVPAVKATAASQEYLNEKLPPEWNKLFVDTMGIVPLPPPTPK